MLSMKLLLAFGLLTGIFVDKCNLGNINVEDFVGEVTVTNVSSGDDAHVVVSFKHGEVGWRLPAGTSRTASGLAATRYSVHVVGAFSDKGLTYKQRLLEVRDALVNLTTNPEAPADKVLDAAAQLPLLVEALQQMQGSQLIQSCSAAIKTGVESHATVSYTKSADGNGFWVLDCG